MMAKKIRHASSEHAYSLSPYFLLFISFVLFLTLRVLECGWIFRRSAIQDQGDFIPPFHAWVTVRGFFDRTFYVAYTDTFLRVPNATRMLENGGVGPTWAVLEEVKLVEGRQKRETRL